MSTHKPYLMSFPPWLQQDYHWFVCSCLVLVKKKKKSYEVLLAFKVNPESIGRNPCVTETHSYGLCASKCSCLHFRQFRNSPRVQKSQALQMMAFPSHLYTLLAYLLTLWVGFLSFLLPDVYLHFNLSNFSTANILLLRTEKHCFALRHSGAGR